MKEKYDLIVLGMGGIGSAVIDRLASAGHSVLGLEQYGPIHDLGSSHGEGRIIRQAYFEDPHYVPLLLRAYELWDELQKYAKCPLLIPSGVLMMGLEESPVIQGCLQAAQSLSLKYELLKTSLLREKYPFHIPEDTVGFLEPLGGYLPVEKCIEQFLKRARERGAELKFHTIVKGWQSHGDEIQVFTPETTYKAERLVICLGAWAGKFLDSPFLPLTPKRVVQYWFHAPSQNREIPGFFQETGEGVWIYGLPPIGPFIKLAFHNIYRDCDPDSVEREVSSEEIDLIEKHARTLLPSLGDFSHAKTCLYTMTPDGHFILGPLPSPRQNVFLAAGFSGHGFKFAPVIGEIVEHYIDGKQEYDLDFLGLHRFHGIK